MHCKPSLAGLALLALVSLAPAQKRVWIVDALGGPGWNFRDLPPALGAAAHGDLIRVRPGTYTGGATDRAIAIVCAPGTSIGALRVRNQPPGTEFALVGATLRGPLAIERCSGRVTIESCQLQISNPGPPRYVAGVAIVGSAAVSLHRCSITGGPAVSAVGSVVSVTSSTLTGYDAISGPSFVWPGRESVYAENATARLTHVTAKAGDDRVTNRTTPRAGVVAHRSALFASGTTTITGGSGGNRVPTGGVTASLSTARVDPGVVVQGGNGGPPFLGVTPVRRPIPALDMQGTASPGATLRGALAGRLGDLFCAFHALPGDPTEIPALNGSVWIDTTRLVVPVQCGVLGVSPARWQIRLPDAPSVAGFTFAWQAVAGTAAAGASVSNAILATVR